jgi:hypothetical protein
MAAAGALAAVRLAEARSLAARLAWALAIVALAAAALLPGGRTALVALLLGVALAPALRLRLLGGAAWALAVLLAGLGGALWLALHPDQVEGLRTL